MFVLFFLADFLFGFELQALKVKFTQKLKEICHYLLKVHKSLLKLHSKNGVAASSQTTEVAAKLEVSAHTLSEVDARARY